VPVHIHCQVGKTFVEPVEETEGGLMARVEKMSAGANGFFEEGGELFHLVAMPA
jgi:hypothetical protein